MKFVKVQFMDSYPHKHYAYKTTLDLECGDIVVVEARSTFGLAKVVQVSGFESKATKFVVCKVDLDEFNKNKAVAKRIEEIKVKLEERKKAFEERKLWELLAASDLEAERLLDELSKLNGKINGN